MKQHVEFVDIAKGFCILILALTHTFGESSGQTMGLHSIFLILILFMSSDFFFREYESIFVFSKKKANQLLIPIFFPIFFSLNRTIISSVKTEKPLWVGIFFFFPNTWIFNIGLFLSTWLSICSLNTT